MGVWMINGSGLCDWEQWQALSDDQRRYELHRVLVVLDNRTLELLKVAKWYSFIGGLLGGSLTVFGFFGVKLAFGGL